MMDFENTSCDGLKGCEDNIGKQRKEDPSYVVAETWGTFLSTVIWKAENMLIKLDDPAREFSGQNVINASFFLCSYSEKEEW